ncbi:prolyl-tRNA editing protein ProX [Clostridium tetanomorphum DSM 665]|uniref:prolyl-tRNA synthetase associated domain-containing protein n=1 Tax=Clostridium tetanomorphum TaxID=1553 RepID=UPI0004511CF8|nr:prolyl-tRNA synthetase associated domain-containing protein [Clostridium tetanomorphum]KAJ51875.1 prolyl-tRNA editing protein ProX [Clostridium tetanomorphum DSM 665]
MLENEQKVYAVLKELKIPFKKYEHNQIFTIEEANKLEINIEGQHCKNLFLRNRKGNKHYLVIVDEWKKVDLKALSKNIGTASLSFASEERLYSYLGVNPGSFTPFGLINDIKKEVEVILDKDIKKLKNISFHPNVNTATITISYEDFERYLQWCENKIYYIDI